MCQEVGHAVQLALSRRGLLKAGAGASVAAVVADAGRRAGDGCGGTGGRGRCGAGFRYAPDPAGHGRRAGLVSGQQPTRHCLRAAGARADLHDRLRRRRGAPARARADARQPRGAPVPVAGTAAGAVLHAPAFRPRGRLQQSAAAGLDGRRWPAPAAGRAGPRPAGRTAAGVSGARPAARGAGRRVSRRADAGHGADDRRHFSGLCDRHQRPGARLPVAGSAHAWCTSGTSRCPRLPASSARIRPPRRPWSRSRCGRTPTCG